MGMIYLLPAGHGNSVASTSLTCKTMQEMSEDAVRTMNTRTYVHATVWVPLSTYH